MENIVQIQFSMFMYKMTSKEQPTLIDFGGLDMCLDRGEYRKI